MQNATKIAATFVDRLPKDVAPETTSGRQGFVHPISVTGSMEQAMINLIIRDFEEDGLAAKEAMLGALAKEVTADYPG
jgi:tripeptide aminopeptidase